MVKESHDKYLISPLTAVLVAVLAAVLVFFFTGGKANAETIKYPCRVLKVLDGDTLDVEIDLGFGIFKRDRIRVYGIDTPEIHSRNKNEKKAGEKAKSALIECLGENTKFEPAGKDKYGRMLGVVYCTDGQPAAKSLISKGIGREYYGTKKEAWDV